MAKLTGANGQAVAQPLFSSSATQYHELGFLATFGGQKFRYVKAGATALVVGNALQATVQDVDHDDVTCRATAIGATSLLITTGSSGGALDENEYADGYAVVDTTPGLGYTYRIKSHAAIAASTNGSLELVDGESVQVALTASSKITLVANPYKNVIQHPVTTASGTCIGGAVYPIVASEYGWRAGRGAHRGHARGRAAGDVGRRGGGGAQRPLGRAERSGLHDGHGPRRQGAAGLLDDRLTRTAAGACMAYASALFPREGNIHA
jgi:hypothetical protein